MTPKSRIIQTHNKPTIWLVFILMAALVLPTFLMPHVWINLRSVEVTTDRIGAIVVTADRHIAHDFKGDFSVSVHREDGSFVCQGAPSDPFTYHKSASLVSPENPLGHLMIMSLEKWIGGRAQLEECQRQGLRDGVFFLVTCHMKINFGLPIATRCVKSNLFGVI